MTEEKKVRRQDKWDAKAGVGAKTYKVELEANRQFREVCDRKKLKYGTELTKLMKRFVEEANTDEE